MEYRVEGLIIEMTENISIANTNMISIVIWNFLINTCMSLIKWLHLSEFKKKIAVIENYGQEPTMPNVLKATHFQIVFSSSFVYDTGNVPLQPEHR